jgi:hypothetical protein
MLDPPSLMHMHVNGKIVEEEECDVDEEGEGLIGARHTGLYGFFSTSFNSWCR